MKRYVLSVLAITTGSLAVAACGDDDESAGDAAQDLCASMGDLQATVAGVAGADIDLESTTVGDVSDRLGDLEDQIDAVEDRREDLTASVVTALVDSYGAYRDAVEDISDDSTLAEAGTEVAAAQTAFGAAWDQTLADLDCGPSST